MLQELLPEGVTRVWQYDPGILSEIAGPEGGLGGFRGGANPVDKKNPKVTGELLAPLITMEIA